MSPQMPQTLTYRFHHFSSDEAPIFGITLELLHNLSHLHILCYPLVG